jgi:hypothetical protein
MAEFSPAKAVRSRWQLLFLLAALVLLAAGFFMLRERGKEARGTASTGTASTQSSAAQAKAKAETGVFPPAFTDPRPDLSNRADHVDVCGIGRVRVQPDGHLDLPEDSAGGQRLVEAAATKQAASGGDVDRALALYVRWAYATRANLPKDAAETRIPDESRQQLARLALASRDPAAYALAFYACGKATPATNMGACAQISAAHWALLDPDNAAPWLYEAAAARRRNEPKGVDEALLRASRARTLRPYTETPLRLVDAAAVRSASPLGAGAALASLMSISAALPAPNLQQLSQYCAGTAKGAAERIQVCSGLAEVLTERSTVLIGMRLGAVMGERAGWPSGRVAAVRKRLADLQLAQTRAIDPKDLYSCAALERRREYLGARARYGEVGAAERAGAVGQRSQK